MGRSARTTRKGTVLLACAVLLGVDLPASTALASQGCTSCRSSDSRTQVSFSSVVSANRLVFNDITVLDAEGKPLDAALYEVIPPTNDVTSAYANGPVIMVDSEVRFTIGFNGKAVLATQPFTVTVVRSGKTQSVSIQDLNTQLDGQVGIDPIGALGCVGVSLRRVQVTQTYEISDTSYRFIGTLPAGAEDSSLSMWTHGTSKRVVFRDTNNRKSTWSLQMRSTTKTSSSRFHASRVNVPRGDQLIVVYSIWHGATGSPSLWLDRYSDGRLDTRLPLVKG